MARRRPRRRRQTETAEPTGGSFTCVVGVAKPAGASSFGGGGAKLETPAAVDVYGVTIDTRGALKGWEVIKEQKARLKRLQNVEMELTAKLQQCENNEGAHSNAATELQEVQEEFDTARKNGFREWKDLGVSTLRLTKCEKTGKVRMLMPRPNGQGTPLINSFLSTIKVSRSGKNMVITDLVEGVNSMVSGFGSFIDEWIAAIKDHRAGGSGLAPIAVATPSSAAFAFAEPAKSPWPVLRKC